MWTPTDSQTGIDGWMDGWPSATLLHLTDTILLAQNFILSTVFIYRKIT